MKSITIYGTHQGKQTRLVVCCETYLLEYKKLTLELPGHYGDEFYKTFGMNGCSYAAVSYTYDVDLGTKTVDNVSLRPLECGVYFMSKLGETTRLVFEFVTDAEPMALMTMYKMPEAEGK